MTTYPRTDSQYADAEFLLSRRQYANLTIRSGKGPGYERRAKVFNLKQLSQAVIWLKEHGDMSYENLQENQMPPPPVSMCCRYRSRNRNLSAFVFQCSNGTRSHHRK